MPPLRSICDENMVRRWLCEKARGGDNSHEMAWAM